MTTPRLYAPCYALGQPRRVETLAEVATDPELRERLCGPSGGLCFYLESDHDALALAAESADATLAEGDLDPEEISAVIFASDSMGEVRGRNARVEAWLRERGIDGAVPLLCSMGECSNLQIALSLASSLVRAELHGAILVVSADVTRVAALGDRIAAGGIGIMSDAASSCIVASARDSEGGFDLEAHAACREPAPRGAEAVTGPLAVVRSLEQKIGAHGRLFAGLWPGGRVPERLTRVFPSNFSRAVLRTFLAGHGFAVERLYEENLARLGHCLASDALIGLADYQRHEEIAPGDRFVMVGSGPKQLGATLLRAA